MVRGCWYSWLFRFRRSISSWSLVRVLWGRRPIMNSEAFSFYFSIYNRRIENLNYHIFIAKWERKFVPVHDNVFVLVEFKMSYLSVRNCFSEFGVRAANAQRGINLSAGACNSTMVYIYEEYIYTLLYKNIQIQFYFK